MDMPAERRTELLDRIVEALLVSGAGDLSLRPLAEQVGSSARLLIYHFESKEQLIAAALAQVRGQVAASLSARSAYAQPQSLRDLLMMFWNWATEAENLRYFRLLFEVDGLAMYNRVSFSEAAKKANSAIWTGLIEGGADKLRDGRGAAHSTLMVAALSGLLQELLATGDREKTTAALTALLDLIDAGAPGARS